MGYGGLTARSEEGAQVWSVSGSVNSQPSHRVCLKVGLPQEGPSKPGAKCLPLLSLGPQAGEPTYLMIVVVVSARLWPDGHCQHGLFLGRDSGLLFLKAVGKTARLLGTFLKEVEGNGKI